jgi:hypothetical protein
MHRTGRLRSKVPVLRKAFHEHAVLHHRKYYKAFGHEPDPVGRTLNIYTEWWPSILLGIPASILLLHVVGPLCALCVAIMLLHHAL